MRWCGTSSLKSSETLAGLTWDHFAVCFKVVPLFKTMKTKPRYEIVRGQVELTPGTCEGLDLGAQVAAREALRRTPLPRSSSKNRVATSAEVLAFRGFDFTFD